MRAFKVWSIIVMLTGLMTLTGCPDEGGTGQAAAPVVPINPNGGACPAGQYMSTNGICIVDNTGTQWSTVLTWGNYLSITNKNQYRKFLQEYGAICDRNDGTLFEFLDFWQANCNTWDDKGYVSIQLANNEIPDQGTRGVVRFFAFNDWSYGNSSYMMLRPLDGTFLNINNNGGFELRKVGGHWYSYNGEISVKVLGRPADTSLAMVLSYRGTEFARASIYNSAH